MIVLSPLIRTGGLRAEATPLARACVIQTFRSRSASRRRAPRRFLTAGAPGPWPSVARFAEAPAGHREVPPIAQTATFVPILPFLEHSTLIDAIAFRHSPP